MQIWSGLGVFYEKVICADLLTDNEAGLFSEHIRRLPVLVVITSGDIEQENYEYIIPDFFWCYL